MYARAKSDEAQRRHLRGEFRQLAALDSATIGACNLGHQLRTSFLEATSTCPRNVPNAIGVRRDNDLCLIFDIVRRLHRLFHSSFLTQVHSIVLPQSTSYTAIQGGIVMKVGGKIWLFIDCEAAEKVTSIFYYASKYILHVQDLRWYTSQGGIIRILLYYSNRLWSKVVSLSASERARRIVSQSSHLLPQRRILSTKIKRLIYVYYIGIQYERVSQNVKITASICFQKWWVCTTRFANNFRVIQIRWANSQRICPRFSVYAPSCMGSSIRLFRIQSIYVRVVRNSSVRCMSPW
jgi:hypothetical protein